MRIPAGVRGEHADSRGAHEEQKEQEQEEQGEGVDRSGVDRSSVDTLVRFGFPLFIVEALDRG
jgi:hypothetical protein